MFAANAFESIHLSSAVSEYVHINLVILQTAQCSSDDFERGAITYNQS